METGRTVRELMKDYVELYGVNKWSVSSYNKQIRLIEHYINPIIGDYKFTDITPRVIEQYYQSLQKVKTVQTQNIAPRTEYVSVHIIREVHKALRCAFGNAVRWELIARNPFSLVTPPKEEHEKREIWDAETFTHALEVCTNPLLKLEINTAFAASLRVGEMLALTWDCVDVSQESIQNGTAYLKVTKEIQRTEKSGVEALKGRGIIRIFPQTQFRKEVKTVLVLKEPKTPTSVRKVFLPKTVAKMLVERKNYLQMMKAMLGDEYNDYDLVFCHGNGMPMEATDVRYAFNRLISENNLPPVVFHSLRHMSITYKLKLTGGDIKAVQGDSGHAQVTMVTDVYSHIIDDDRKKNAELIESAFYESDRPGELTESAAVQKGATVPAKESLFQANSTALEKDPSEFAEEPSSKPDSAAVEKGGKQYGTSGKENGRSGNKQNAVLAAEKEKAVMEESTAKDAADNMEVLAKLLQNPETASLLKALAAKM